MESRSNRFVIKGTYPGHRYQDIAHVKYLQEGLRRLKERTLPSSMAAFGEGQRLKKRLNTKM